MTPSMPTPAGRSILGFVPHHSAAETSPHRDLLELPATLENINAKVNHLIVRTEYGIRVSEKADKAAQEARRLADHAKRASHASSQTAIEVIGQKESLPRMQRWLAISMGAVVGGAGVGFLLRVLAALGTAIGISSCAHVGF